MKYLEITVEDQLIDGALTPVVVSEEQKNGDVIE